MFTRAVSIDGRTLAERTAVILVAGYCVLFVWALGGTSFDVWGALFVGPVLLLVSLRPLRRLSGGDRWLFQLLVAALLLKLLASVVRYYMAFDVYDGVADAAMYHEHGERLAPYYRVADFSPELGRDFIGTGFLRALTGVVYALIGPTRIGGFLVFSWLGFWGLCLLFAAFRSGVPNGDHRRYARLVFFLPSLLFWPSSIGKEAWMTLAIGLTALGAARVLTRAPRGFPLLLAGGTAITVLRPHVALVAFVALLGAYLIRRSPGVTLLGPVVKVAGAAFLLVLGTFVVSQVESFLKIDDLRPESVDQAISETTTRSSQGGSRFSSSGGMPSVTGFPMAVVTVLFRPFPHEAHNAQALATSLEGVLLLALVGLSFGRLLQLPRLAWRSPYLVFATAFLLLFAFAFAGVGNFGIIARQRVQALPFLLVLLSLPKPITDDTARRRPRRAVGAAA